MGRRVQVVLGCLIGVAAALAGLWYTPAALWQVQWLAIFMVGFFLYPPQMLIGLMGAEVVSVDSIRASADFLGWAAIVGAAFAGLPLSLLVKELVWDSFFKTLIGACFLAFIFMSKLANAKSSAQLLLEKKKGG